MQKTPSLRRACAAILLALVVGCAAVLAAPIPARAASTAAESAVNDYLSDYSLKGFLEWMLARDDLTDAQEADLENALEMFEGYVDSGEIDWTDADDAASLDNLEYAAEILATIEELRAGDEYYNQLYTMPSLYTNFTMMVGSAYTANVSIYEVAHVSSYSTFASNENLAWGYSDPTAGWYTKEKAYVTAAMESLGYSVDTLTTSEWAEVTSLASTNASAAGTTIGHYTNLFYGVSSGKDALAGVGYTTEFYLYSTTSSFNACYASKYSSYEAYTPAEFLALIAEYRAYLASELTSGWTQLGSCEWQIDGDGVLTVRPLAEVGVIPSVTSTAPWYDDRASITGVVIEDGVVASGGLAYLFYGCTALVSADLSGLDTSMATSLAYAFYGCTALESIDVSGWDTSAVTKMHYLFSGCSSLASLDLSSWDTSAATKIGSMFKNCTGLRTVVLGSGFSFTGDGSTSCVLPTPLDGDAEGWWVDDSGTVYDDPADIPSNVSATYTATFKTSLSGATVELSTTSFTYSGSARTPKPTVTVGDTTLTSGTDYTVSYSNNTDVGTATVTVTGCGNYTDTATASFTITAKSISLATVSLSTASYTYDGAAKKPSVKSVELTLNGSTVALNSSTDYTVSWASGRTDAGTYKVTVTGKGNYTGTATASFTINAKSLSSAAVTLSTSSYTYNGAARKPTPTVKVSLNGSTKTLTKGTDYTVSYSSNTDAGTATCKVTGTGNYTGTIKKTFTIKAKSVSSATVKLSYTSTTYSGSAKKPSVKSVKLTLNGSTKTLTKGTDYTVTYSSNTKVGTATVTITGTGNYKGTVKKTFKIKPKTVTVKSVKSSAKKKATVRWTKLSSANVTKYQIRYRVKGTSTWKTVKVSSSKSSYTLTGLKSGKTYQVQVRAYKTVSGTNYVGSWSSTKTVKVK